MASDIRQKIMDWISFGSYVFAELIPMGGVVFNALLKFFPKGIQREFTKEKQLAKVAEWKGVRDADDDQRNLRRTDAGDPDPDPEPEPEGEMVRLVTNTGGDTHIVPDGEHTVDAQCICLPTETSGIFMHHKA